MRRELNGTPRLVGWVTIPEADDPLFLNGRAEGFSDGVIAATVLWGLAALVIGTCIWAWGV